MAQRIPRPADRLVTTATRRQQLHKLVDGLADFCEFYDGSYLHFEKKFRKHLWAIARLFIAFFLVARHQRLQQQKRDYPGYRLFPKLCRRTLRTPYGKVRYKRAYWIKRGRQRGRQRARGGGFHPLDAELGLTRDGFSPWVISLACRLSVYLSYAKSTLVVEAFWGWSPSTETVEQWNLGLAREASTYMASSPPFAEPEGEMLIIEVDSKAVPTARDEELAKRRGPRKKHDKACDCGCQRHRGQAKRRRCGRGAKSREKRRKKGDKSKNGRSATLVAIYTLRRGPDGRWHGPINKRVWGSFGSRKKMVAWARAEATRRGFGPDSGRPVQIVVDGETCLAKRLRKQFPKATLTLDIRHVEERLWKTAGAFHPEGSPELAAWVETLRDVLYNRSGWALVRKLEAMRKSLEAEEGAAEQRTALDKLIQYLKPRAKMMRYRKLIDEDKVIASGVIEGAVRYVIGERMDCSGMRWVREKGEAILHLRCIEVNGLWDHFFEWSYNRWQQKLTDKEVVQIRTDQGLMLNEAA